MRKIIFKNRNGYIFPISEERLKKIYETIDSGDNDYSINDVLEMYNIILYFEHYDRIPGFSIEEDLKYRKEIRKIEGIVYKFINTINCTNIENRLNIIDWEYIKTFWHLAEKCKFYNKISLEEFNLIIACPILKRHIELFEVSQRFIEHFIKEIKDWVLSSNIETVIDIILAEYKIEKCNKYLKQLSDILSVKEKNDLMTSYITSDDAHLNYLEFIPTIQSSEIFAKVKSLAIKRAEQQTKEFFSQNSGMKYGWNIAIGGDTEETQIESTDSHYVKSITYSKKYLESTLDFPSILNNFIYIFGFVDLHMRSTEVSLLCDLGALERAMLMDKPKYFKYGIAFGYNDMRFWMSMSIYYSYLKENNIQFERVIEWFFKDYLKQEFSINGFGILLSQENATYYEKCLLISTAIESAIHQYELYTEEGEIDLNILQFEFSTPYESVKSLIPEKYSYGCSDNFYKLQYLLFSDQSMLGYIEKLNLGGEDDFLDVIKNYEVSIDCYDSFYRQDIMFLIEQNIIAVNEKGLLEINDKEKVFFLQELFSKGVICNYWYGEKLSKKIHQLHDEGLIEFSSTLFTKYESDLLNFRLNKQQFYNGENLRNKYAHGAMALFDEEIHKKNYFTFLRTMILIIIKINDELCYIDEQSNKE